MGRIKGAAIRARLEFLRKDHGDDAVVKVIETLDPMDQVVLSGTVLPSIWYPFHVLANLDEAIRRALATSGKAILFVSSAIALGYATLCLSGFRVHVQLGSLVALAMLVSSASALLLLPAVLGQLRPRFVDASAPEPVARGAAVGHAGAPA